MDLRYAIRGFRRNPGFSLAAILSLAIGIGANTSMFSVTSALLLHPLPYRDAGRLVILWNTSPGLNITQDWFSTAQYFDIRDGHHGFEQVAIAIGGNYNLTGTGEPERIGTIQIGPGLLAILGAEPLSGRLFTSADNLPGAPLVAILNYGTWMRRFGGDPRAVGRSLTLNGKPYTVVGVLPRWFSLPQEVMPTLGRAEDAEILVPLPLDAADVTQRGREDYNVIAKLRPGVSVRQAQAEMEGLTARLRRDYPELYPPNGGLTFQIVPLLEQVVGDSRRTLWMLLASVGFVLLIACSNVANLLLSRALARQKEIAVRAAMGAGRARIVRQLLTESVLLALAGGALGVVLAFWSVRWIRAMGVRSVPRLGEVAVNGEVLLFTLVLSLAAGILFGLAPAWRAGRLDLYGSLKEAGRAAGTSAVWGRGNHLRRLLVVSELALSVILLIGAGLLLRSFARLQAVAPGFNPKNVLTLELTMSGRRYNNGAAVIRGYRDILERIDRLPGVTASGAVSALPLSQMFSWGPLWVEGRVRPPGEKFLNADVRITYGRYFQAMEIPLIRGRFFNEHDVQSNPHVAIVDESMAQQLWPGDDPLGKRMRIGGAESKSPLITVVGVAGRVKQYALDADSRIAYYLPHYAVSRPRNEPRGTRRRGGRGAEPDPRGRHRPAGLPREDDDGAGRRSLSHAAGSHWCCWESSPRWHWCWRRSGSMA